MEKKLTVRIRGEVHMIPLDSIVYMENERRRIRLRTTGGELLFYGTFRQILPQLGEQFLCCSRSYIANMDHICGLRRGGLYEILLDNGHRLYVGRNCYHRVKSGFEDYLRRNRREAGGEDPEKRPRKDL